MARFLKSKKASIGQVPGKLIFIGEKKEQNIGLKFIQFSTSEFIERDLDSASEAITLRNDQSVTWISVYGLHDLKIINKIGTDFGIHPLTLEDIVNTGQRPKMEEYDDYLFFSLKVFQLDHTGDNITSEQLSIILGRDYIITFQETVSDIFEPVKNRIKKGRSKARRSGSGYLTYALLDTIIDNYLLVIGNLGEYIEELEEEILSDPGNDILSKIYSYKQEISYLRKSIRPTRAFTLKLTRVESIFMQEDAQPFLKDLLDLATQSSETIDIYNSMLSDQLELYNSGVNNKLNEIIKVLTIFSVVFIPLTFLAGVYGTNFSYLPELQYKYSYFIFWIVLILTAVGMLAYFRRKKWL